MWRLLSVAVLLAGLLSAGVGWCQARDISVNYWGTGGAETIQLDMVNCSQVAATHSVRAGEAHACTVPGHQPLITAGDQSFTLAAGERRTVLVPVYCGNSRVPCPDVGMAYRAPSPPYPRLREIILTSGGTAGASLQTQLLIWHETDRNRLRESGPPTFLETVTSGGRLGARAATPQLMCLGGYGAPPDYGEISRTQAQEANLRAIGLVTGFVSLPLPLAIILSALWLRSPHRRRGPHHA